MIFILSKEDVVTYNNNKKKIQKLNSINLLYTEKNINNFYVDLSIGLFDDETIVKSKNLNLDNESSLNDLNIKIISFSDYMNDYIQRKDLVKIIKDKFTKPQEEETVYKFIDEEESHIFNRNLLLKDNFKKYLIDKKYLTPEQLQEVQNIVDDNKNHNINSHIIEIARKKEYITNI